jgi:uncharacterized protein
MKIKILEGDYAVIKYNKIISRAFANIQDTDETTVIIKASEIPKDAIDIEKTWKIIKFDTILDFSLVGFLAKVSSALAKEKISIFAISAYSTDYILVKKENLDKSKNILEKLK